MHDPSQGELKADNSSSDGPSAAPEVRLLARMLEVAVQDATEKNDSDKRQAALRWLNDDGTSAGSAHWTCDLLGIDLELVRGALRARPNEVRKAVFSAHKQ